MPASASRGRPAIPQKATCDGGTPPAAADAYGDDALRRRLLDGAIAFVETLPPK
jgi:hypothetical protein